MGGAASAPPKLGCTYSTRGGKPACLETDWFPDSNDAPTSDESVNKLPRGGVHVSLQSGSAIQFGIPPNTIKDSLKYGLAVPDVYVIIGEEMFDRQLSINIAEFEFPAYFNFFVRNRPTTLVCFQAVAERVKTIFRETLLGPETHDPKADFDASVDPEHYPDFWTEGLALDPKRDQLQIEMLLDFRVIDGSSSNLASSATSLTSSCSLEHSGTKVTPNKVVLSDSKENPVYIKWNAPTNKFTVRENKRTLALVKGEFAHPRTGAGAETRHLAREAFTVPTFGVTMLGTSHGFDPDGTTTGFVVWVNRRGVMVDPPTNSSQFLQSLGIPYRLIDAIIITHCHADHDAGAFQKILIENQITIFTTPTIMESFVRKYSAISGFPAEFMYKLFKFQPVKIGASHDIHGAAWDFFYSLHVIPTIGFEVKLNGEGIVYSGDTRTDPELLKDMKKRKQISAARYDDLANKGPLQRWRTGDKSVAPYHPYVLHEAGVPPIHTSVEFLAKLPAEILKRMFVVHINKDMLKGYPTLQNACAREWSTIEINVGGKEGEKETELVQLLATIPLFKSLAAELSHSQNESNDLELIASFKTYKAGSVLMDKGSMWDRIVVIRAGVVYEGDDTDIFDDARCEWQGRSESWLQGNMLRVAEVVGEQSILLSLPEEHWMSASEEGEQNRLRTASRTYTTMTDVHTLEFDPKTLVPFLTRHPRLAPLVPTVVSLARSKSLPSWEIFSRPYGNRMLGETLKQTQQQELQQLVEGYSMYNAREVIREAGSPQKYFRIVVRGSIEYVFDPSTQESNDKKQQYTTFRGLHSCEQLEERRFGPDFQLGPEKDDRGGYFGTMFGDVNAALKDYNPVYSLTAASDGTKVYELPVLPFVEFLGRHPGVELRMLDSFYIL